MTQRDTDPAATNVLAADSVDDLRQLAELVLLSREPDARKRWTVILAPELAVLLGETLGASDLAERSLLERRLAEIAVVVDRASFDELEWVITQLPRELAITESLRIFVTNAGHWALQRRAERLKLTAASPETGLWVLFAAALAESEGGVLYVGGSAGKAEAAPIEEALRNALDAVGIDTEFGDPVVGSWWRPFKTSVRRRVSEGDFDTLKRAGEVQVLDRHESQAAKAYAEAIAALATAVESQDYAYLFAKNVLLVKTLNGDGRSVIASRVLTSAEVLRFEAGELSALLSSPTLALEFVTQARRPVSPGN